MKITKLNFATALFLTISLLMFSSCGNETIEGEGPVVSDDYVLAEFDAIDIEIPAKVTITKSTDQEITLRAQQNILNEMDVRVENKTLKIKFSDKHFNLKEDVEVFLSMETLKEIDLSGAVEVLIGNFDVMDKLKMDASGGCSLHFTEEGTTINEFTADLSGAASIKAFNAEMKTCNLDLSGACDVDVYVTDHFDVDASGACVIRYKGDPELDTDSSGTVTIEKID